jgi:tetratricopeptide (TPR) repeat protein
MEASMGWGHPEFGYVAALVDRYERTGDGEGLLGVVLPDETLSRLPRIRRRRQATLRLLALLRWYRYVQLPGVLGLIELRALTGVLDRLGGGAATLPEPLRALAAAVAVAGRDAPEVLHRDRIDQLVFLLHSGGVRDDWDALDAGSALAVRWLAEARRGYERAALLTDIAEVTYRYGRAGAPNGYARAEQHAAAAVAATGPADPHLANRLVLQARFAESLGTADARKRAVACYRRAAEAAGRRPPVDLRPLRGLAVGLASAYEATGSVAALVEAVQATRDLLRAIPPGNPDAAKVEVLLAGLCDVARTTIGEQAVTAILDGAVDLPQLQDALARSILDPRTPPEQLRTAASVLMAVLPAEDHRRPGALIAVAQAELNCCRSGTIDQATCAALELAARAVQGAPPERSTLRVEAYGTLAEVLRHVVCEHGDHSRVAEAVQAIRRTRDLLTHGDPLHAAQLGSLADMLGDLAGAVSDPSLRREVVALQRAAVERTPSGAEDRVFRLANLAGSLQELAVAEGDQGGIDEAVAFSREALAAVPVADPRRVGLLFNLAAELSNVISGEPSLARLDEAESAYLEGRALLPAGHPDQPRFMSAIALVRYKRHQLTGDRQALAEAVELARDAVATTPHAHPWWPQRNWYLARFADDLYRLDGQADVSLRAEALTAYAVAGRSPRMPAGDRIEARRRGAGLAHAGGDHAAALQALEAAIAEIPQLARRSLVSTVRLDMSRRLGALATEAAGIAIAAGQPDRALELLEQCRAVLHREAIAVQGHVGLLRGIDPGTADELERIESELAEADLYTQVQSINMVATVESTSGDIERRAETSFDPRPGSAADTRRLAGERDRILQRLAHDPRFEMLLTAPPLAQLRTRIHGGPVVAVLSHEDRGHALVLCGPPETPVRHLELPGMARSAVLAQVERLDNAVADAADAAVPFARRRAAQDDLHGVLEWLWDHAAGPVLELLDTLAPRQERLWWCPIGPLTRLPLHAAGHHRDPRPERTVLDRTVSSYTPTIATLAYALRDEPVPAAPADPDVLIIAVPRTPSRPPLPQAEAEARAVHGQVPGARVLLGDAADLATITAGLRDARIVHFACHADSGTGARLLGGSGLHLASGEKLTPIGVHSARPSQGELAFLSACGTAEAHPDLPDEPMHLAAGFQLAGFRGVIGTMWRTPDSPHIARAVYATLTSGGSAPPDTRQAATALTEALRSSRDAYLSSPTRWAAYLHVGA